MINVATLRWGKSEGAYRKYSYIFSKPLPFKLDSRSPISEASYIRDVIAYANANDLPGKEWFQKVTVSPQDDGTVLVKSKAGHNLNSAKRYPTHTVFDLLKMLGDGEVKDAYRCITTEEASVVIDMLEGFEEWDVLEIEKHAIEFRLKPVIGAQNAK